MKLPIEVKPPGKVLFLAFSYLIVIAAYVWFISFGRWVTWQPTTTYYDQLATAFLHKSLALEMEVDPSILSLSNPYNPDERTGMDYPLDFVLYQGKYYLNFGPAPAFLLALLKVLGVGQVGDQYLVFAFICVLFIFQSLIIKAIRDRFLQDVPDWVVPVCIVFAGLVSPFAWMLTEARVYEVANTGGQAFFLAGLFFYITSVTQDSVSPGRLFIGSTLWAFAMGSRWILVLPIGLAALIFASFFIYWNTRQKTEGKVLFQILCISIPFAAGICILGWYNWARFHSVFENGISYLLTTIDVQANEGRLFSPIYMLPNLYDYLLAGPKQLITFPFLKSVHPQVSWLFPFITLPEIYLARPITGILFSTPFVLFAQVSLISFAMQKFKTNILTFPEMKNGFFNWIIAALWGSFLSVFALYLSFFWVVTRYITDFSPSLILLSLIGFWIVYPSLEDKPVVQSVYLSVGFGLMVLSILVSTLLVFAIRAPLYRELNPILWNQLQGLFAVRIGL